MSLEYSLSIEFVLKQYYVSTLMNWMFPNRVHHLYMKSDWHDASQTSPREVSREVPPSITEFIILFIYYHSSTFLDSPFIIPAVCLRFVLANQENNMVWSNQMRLIYKMKMMDQKIWRKLWNKMRKEESAWSRYSHIYPSIQNRYKSFLFEKKAHLTSILMNSF